MTNYPDFVARQPSPHASSATADLLVAACQRAFALQAEWMDQMVNRGLEQSRQTVTGSLSDPRAAALAAMRGPWQQNALAEPLWRYLAGLMVVGRETTAAIMALTQAQMRRANDEVLMLARQAHEEADRATGAVSAAVGRAAGANGRSTPAAAPREPPAEREAAQAKAREPKAREPRPRSRKATSATKQPRRGRGTGTGRPRASR